MMDTQVLDEALKDIKNTRNRARDLSLRLPLLSTGTGKQRNELLLELRTFFELLVSDAVSPLHRLNSFKSKLTNPEYEDTLGYNSLDDFKHIDFKLTELKSDFQTVLRHFENGTQPKQWLTTRFSLILLRLIGLEAFTSDILAKL